MREAFVCIALAGCGHIEFARPSLMAWYPCTSNQSEGTVIADASGEGNVAACTPPACPELIADAKFGAAYHYDGVDDHYVIRDAAIFHSAQVSIALWFNADNVVPTLGAYAPLSKPLGAQRANSWQIELNDAASISFTAEDLAQSTPRYLWGGSYTPGAWVHVVGTWDGTTKTLYVNGAAAAAESPANIELDAHDIILGGDISQQDADKLDDLFVGRICDVRIYARALSAADVEALAAQ